MIFSAAAFTVKLSIFLPIPATSMRRVAPSRIQAPEPSNCDADSCPAVTSADPMAWRRASTVGAPMAGGAGSVALANAPSVTVSAEPNPFDGAAGKGVTTLFGAAALDSGAIWVAVEIAGRTNSPTGLAAELCFIPGPELHPPAPGPNGEYAGPVAAGV